MVLFPQCGRPGAGRWRRAVSRPGDCATNAICSRLRLISRRQAAEAEIDDFRLVAPVDHERFKLVVKIWRIDPEVKQLLSTS